MRCDAPPKKRPKLSPGSWVQKYVAPAGAGRHFAFRNLRLAPIRDAGLCCSSVVGMAISIACRDEDTEVAPPARRRPG